MADEREPKPPRSITQEVEAFVEDGGRKTATERALKILQGEAWEDGYYAAQQDWVNGAEKATENPFVSWTDE